METNQRDEREEIPIAGDFVLTEIFCKSCEFTAETDEHLGDHVIKKHTTWFNCGTCDYRTREKLEIEDHLDKHNQAKYGCEECNVNFTNEENSNSHRIEKHQEQLPSQQVLNTTSWEENESVPFTADNLEVHTKETEVGSILVCNRFVSQMELDNHVTNDDMQAFQNINQRKSYKIPLAPMGVFAHGSVHA